MSTNKTQKTYLGGVPLERLYTTRKDKEDQVQPGPKQKTKRKKPFVNHKKTKKPSNLVARAIIEEYGAQSGEEMISTATQFMKDLSTYSNLAVSDEMIREVEGIVALLINISDCQSFVGVTAAIFGYCRSHMSSSMTSQILSYLDDLFVKQSGSEDDGSFEPDWMTMMRNIRTNWQLVKGNRLFSEFSKILGLLVTFQLCSVTDVTYTIKDYKIVEPDLKVVHGDALDVIDAAFGTVMFFVENIYESIQTKSLRPFLCSDRTASELEEEYAKLVLWWDLVKNGNLMKVAKVSDNEFDRRLEDLCTRVKNLLTGKQTYEKKILQDKYMRLLKVKNDYITLKISSGVRKAPFAIELYGESSQGKTTAGDQIIDAILKSAGLPTGKEYRASYNPSDKYFSSWATNKVAMLIDDVANDKSNFVERPPTRVIVDVCNNQPYYANMADLDSKGKVFVEPAIVLANTNVKHLDAYVYSNCPYSIQRRMKFVLTVEAKLEFQFMVDGQPQGIDSEKVDAHYATLDREPVFDDIWNINIEKAVKPEKLTDIASYEFVTYRGQVLKNVPFRTAVQFLIDEYAAHERHQERIMERNRARANKMELCPHPECRQIHGICDLHDELYPLCPVIPTADPSPPEDFEKQVGDEIGDVLLNGICDAGEVVRSRIMGDVTSVSTVVETASSIALMAAAKYFYNRWDWVCVLPQGWVNDPTFQDYMMVLRYQDIRAMYAKQTAIMWSVALLIMYWGGMGLISLICFCYVVTRQIFMVESVKRSFREELLKRNTLGIAASLQHWRDDHAPRIFKALGFVGVLYSMGKLYRKFMAMKVQGSLEPLNEQEIAIRDAEDNPYTTVALRPLPVSLKSKCTSPTELAGVIAKNLVYGTIITEDDRKLMANALFIRSNVLVMPSHYFETDELKCTFRKDNPEQSGGKFPCVLHKKQSVLIPNTDLRVCYAHSGGSYKNITGWLPESNLPEHEFTLLWRKKDGELVVSGGRGSPKVVSNGVCDFEGGVYSSLEINTFSGLCGAILISHGSGASVSGIHLGGRENTNRGCYGILTEDQYVCAEEMLRQIEGVIISGDGENFQKQCFGVDLLESKPLHPKSPLNWMPRDSQIAYHGSCPGQVSSYSQVRVTKMSPLIMEVFGEPNIWHGPKMRPEWFGWQTCLANMSLPALPFKFDVLEIAIKDYKSDLLKIYQRAYIRKIHPLSDQDNLCGQDGIKFIDAINLSTAIGHPLVGPKRKYVIEEKDVPRTFEPIIWIEIQRVLDCYLKGERAYVVAKAVKKDEVLAKEKCRIFFGNPIALTFLVRKYFLPLIRVMQLFPLKSECAVGINSHGPEWQQLHDHAHKFGSDRIIGGDYGKYDQKLSSQLLFASLRILIDFARECDYSAEDIRVMEAMTGDLVYAMIAFNGDLISLTEGSHISGNSLTVILNGICGSLNLRCAFYTKYVPPTYEERIPFRKVVSLMTYGDDNIGSVCPSIEGFHIKSISEFLGVYGQTYTMPDKESELVPFLNESEFEFLKRKSVFCPHKGVVVGALVEKSIFKMLHCYMYGKKCPYTEEWACAQNIDTALREWENHGEAVYERRRIQMKEVCEFDARIKVLCTRLDVPYSQCVDEWRAKYDKSYIPFSNPDVPVLVD